MNQTYIIKPGDTLYGISNQFGVSVSDILSINNINPSNLQVGQVINVPTIEGTNPNDTFYYTVKKGDTLYGISIRYNTTVQNIKKLNNLVTNNLSIGQQLLIPETYNNNYQLPNFFNYTVKKGDTLYTIAKNNNVDVNTIIKDNSLKNADLSIGQTLKIRIENNGVVEECFGAEYNEPNLNYVNYTVKKGDSLYAIANKYKTSVSTIIKLNNLTSTNLSIGQVISVPNSSSIEQTYTVKSGDNLYTIAKKYNTTVDSIKRKNNLVSNTLIIGQKLLI